MIAKVPKGPYEGEALGNCFSYNHSTHLHSSLYGNGYLFLDLEGFSDQTKIEAVVGEIALAVEKWSNAHYQLMREKEQTHIPASVKMSGEWYLIPKEEVAPYLHHPEGLKDPDLFIRVMLQLSLKLQSHTLHRLFEIDTIRRSFPI